MGYALWQQAQPAQALAALERALALDPQQPPTHYFRALALRSQGRWDEAEASFQQSLNLDPGNAVAYLDLAHLCARQARYPQAERYFAEAVELAPHTAPLRLAQASFYRGRLYRVERGLRAAQEAVRLDPPSAEAWDALGWGFYLNLRPDEAMGALARALELAPDLAAAHYHLAVIHERQLNRLAAVRAYQQAAALDRSGTYSVRAQQALEGLR